MPLTIPTRAGIIASLQTYIRAALDKLDPTPSRRSAIGGKVKSEGSALHDWYVALKDYGDNEPFPQSARGKFLTQGWWRDIAKIDPRPAAAAVGYVVLQGVEGTSLAAGSQLTANGVTYNTDSTALIVAQTLRPASITYDGPTNRCIVKTQSEHLLATGMTVTISDATPSSYNGTVTIAVTADDEFTYRPSEAPISTPAGGTPVVAATWAAVRVTAGSLGTSANVSAGGTLMVLTSDPGLDPTAIATWGGIAGGTEKETPDQYRERILQVLGTDFGAFSADEIEIVAKTVPGVTRVFVKRPTLGGTNGVLEGQVKVAFLRDLDPVPFPTSAEVADVKAAILTQCMTANTAEEDVIVMSPVPRSVPVALTITPDTSAMRAACTNRIKQWFAETATYEGTIKTLDLRCALLGLVDPVTRATIKTVDLHTPSTDVTLGENEFPQCGGVTFL